jgi:hypothetical protein
VRAPASALALLTLTVAVSASGCLGSGGLFGGGISPRDYLSSSDYTTWVIEVDSVQGQAPSSGALDLLRSRLLEVADKPGGIEVRQSETLDSRGGTWSSRDIVDLDAATQDVKTGGKTVVTHLLFLDGRFETDNVIGVAIGHGTIAIFSETIRDSCTPLNGCLSGTDSVFRAVLVHEFGHAMGLVDNGIPMVRPHEDPDHPAHSDNDGSVMYWAVETTNIFNLFRGGPPTTFDGNDKADLCAISHKC